MKKILVHSVLVAVALTIAACSATPVRRSMKETWNDTLTAEKVRYKLMRDSEVKKSAMHVQVFRGQVTLTGRAMTDAEKNRAETVAKSVKRVNGVENYIHVVGSTATPLTKSAPVVAVNGKTVPAAPSAAIQEKTLVTEKITEKVNVTLSEDEMPASVPTVHVGTGTGKTALPKSDTKLAIVQKTAASNKNAVAKSPINKKAPVVTAVVKKTPPTVVAVPTLAPSTTAAAVPHREMVPMTPAPAAKVVGQAKTGLPWDGEVYEDDASSVKSKPVVAPVATRAATPVVSKAPLAAQSPSALPAPAAVTGSDDLAKEAAQELEKLRQKK